MARIKAIKGRRTVRTVRHWGFLEECDMSFFSWVLVWWLRVGEARRYWVCLTIGDSGGVVIPVAGPPVEVNEEPARGVERWKWETSVSDEVSGWVEKEAQEGSRREGCAEEEGAMAMVDEVGDSGSGGGA